MSIEAAAASSRILLRRGLLLAYLTLARNGAGTVVLMIAAVAPGSVTLAGFGVDSLTEILASSIVVWQLKGDGVGRERRALRGTAIAFALLAIHIAVKSAILLTCSWTRASAGGGGQTPSLPC